MRRMQRTLVVVAAVGTASVARADVELTLEELPAAVRATVELELRGGIIDEIERDEKQGRIVYEVEFVREGQEYELDIAEDGSLLRRHRD